MVVDGLRSCYQFKARPYPGGPVVTCQWMWADPNAKPFLEETAYFPYSQHLQFDNTIDDENNVGELTRSGYRGTGEFP